MPGFSLTPQWLPLSRCIFFFALPLSALPNLTLLISDVLFPSLLLPFSLPYHPPPSPYAANLLRSCLLPLPLGIHERQPVWIEAKVGRNLEKWGGGVIMIYRIRKESTFISSLIYSLIQDILQPPLLPFLSFSHFRSP